MEAFISKNYSPNKQDGVHRALIEMLSGKCTNDIDIEMSRFPYPVYANNKFPLAL